MFCHNSDFNFEKKDREEKKGYVYSQDYTQWKLNDYSKIVKIEDKYDKIEYWTIKWILSI